jgi:hypothetical protein
MRQGTKRAVGMAAIVALAAVATDAGHAHGVGARAAVELPAPGCDSKGRQQGDCHRYARE